MGYKDDPCWAGAADDELRFVLLARDPEAPAVVRHWAAASAWRQPAEWLDEALVCADEMERWGRERFPEKWAARDARWVGQTPVTEAERAVQVQAALAGLVAAWESGGPGWLSAMDAAVGRAREALGIVVDGPFVI